MSTLYNIQQVAVIGAGTMGRGIVISLARAGLAVQWLDNDPGATEAGLAMIAQTWAQQVAKGRIAQAEADACLARVHPVMAYDDLAAADLVIEAVYESLALKQAIFRTLDSTLKADAILASNTSALDIDAIAAVTRRPEQVLGLHFFSPAHVMRLLEVVRGARTSPAVLDAAQAIGQRMGKEVVVAGNCPGFIGNRMLASYVAEARKLLLEGATPRQVDGALQAFGMAMGPFRMYDVVGLDLEWRTRQLAGNGMDAPLVQVDNALCALGRFGQKSGQGYYRYTPAAVKPGTTPKSTRWCSRSPRTLACTGARSTTRKSANAACWHWSTKARKFLRKRWRVAALTSTGCTCMAMVSRTRPAGRCIGPTSRA